MVISEEKRKSERIKYYQTLSYRLFGKNLPLPERFLRTADILDISSGGIRIRTLSIETNFDIGSILLLNVPLPKMPVTLSLLGKVRWMKLESPTTRQVGLEFLKPIE